MASTLTIIYWAIKIVGALLVAAGAALGLSKRAEDKRAALMLGRPLMGAPVARGAAVFRRDAVPMSSGEYEITARLDDVIDKIHTGDVLLFSGKALHSYINRIACWTRMSHCGMAYRDSHTKEVYFAEVVERLKIIRTGWRFRVDKGGFRKVLLREYVEKYPGQVYWGPVAEVYDHPESFNRIAAHAAIDSSKAWSYGWLGILFQIRCKTPFLRIVTYVRHWRDIDKAWDKGCPPFCSWAVSLWATIAGQDPTPRLAPQLTTPAEIERSKLWDEPIALIPNYYDYGT